jgi:spore coat polysaccharide biosynthesis protein SpsF
MKTVIGIQARSNSTRLPGKIYEKIGDKTLLEHVYTKCKTIEGVEVIILGPQGDKRLQEECLRIGAPCDLHPEEDNVLGRYTNAIKDYEAEAIVRVTSDCLEVSPEILGLIIKSLENSDYVSSCLYRSFPEGVGDIQAASAKGLEWIAKNAEDKEHVFGLFEANEMIRNKFIEAGLKIRPIINVKNEVFVKTSIDTKEELGAARKRYAGQS